MLHQPHPCPIGALEFPAWVDQVFGFSMTFIVELSLVDKPQPFSRQLLVDAYIENINMGVAIFSFGVTISYKFPEFDEGGLTRCGNLCYRSDNRVGRSRVRTRESFVSHCHNCIDHRILAAF